ncbi:MAG: hypothetical protein VX899_20585 [Myxococcota bacterium]|nr:hypothetical protein [Myxococcota bacterium]
MPEVYCQGLERSVTLAEGEDLLHGLLKAGVPVASTCRGDGICGQCAMWVEGPQGPVGELEARTMKRQRVQASQRLACRVVCQHGQVLRTSYWGVPKS